MTMSFNKLFDYIGKDSCTKSIFKFQDKRTTFVEKKEKKNRSILEEEWYFDN